MICQECGKKPASLHFTKIVNGEKTEFHICDTCAREKGEMIPGTANGFSIHNLLSGLLNFEPSSTSNPNIAPMSLRCEECGLTYSQFSKLGRFGCSSCYKYFSDRLDPLFERVHGSSAHTGKVPKRTGGLLQQKRNLEELRKELAVRINQEEFELAAEVRDQIRELEKRLAEG